MLVSIGDRICIILGITTHDTWEFTPPLLVITTSYVIRNFSETEFETAIMKGVDDLRSLAQKSKDMQKLKLTERDVANLFCMMVKETEGVTLTPDDVMRAFKRMGKEFKAEITEYKELSGKEKEKKREKLFDLLLKLITEQGKKGKTGYEKMLNGEGLNKGLRASKRRMKPKQTVTEKGLETVGEQEIDGVRVALSNFHSINITDNTRKIFDILTIKLTKQIPYDAPAEKIFTDRRVTLTLDEYMEFCGLKDRKEAKKQLKNNAETLYHFSLEWEEKCKVINPTTGRKKYISQHWKARLFDVLGDEEIISENRVTLSFAADIALYLTRAYITPINLQAFTINTHNHPHAYSLYRKMLLHYNENVHKYEAVRISVENLLQACPTIPKAEEVNGQHYTQQIRDPFERDLIALRDIYGLIEEWHYCNSGNEPLTDEQQTAYDFQEWCSWLVQYTLPDYPEREIKKRRKNEKPQTVAIASTTQSN